MMIGLTSRKESSSASQYEEADEIYKLENFVVLRLPMDVAENLREALKKQGCLGTKQLQISFSNHHDLRRATIRFDRKDFFAKLVDLPCIVEVLKTLDKKNFYKVADMSQMLICRSDTENNKSDEESEGLTDKKKEKQFHWPHGITPPLKNVRKRRHRKTMKKKYVDAPELDKELKRLLRADLDAVHVRWEVVTEEQESLQNEQGTSENVPMQNVPVSSGRSGAQKPPEFSNLNLHEHEVFGGRVSSSSEEEGEGGAMARELLAGCGISDPSNNPVDDLTTDIFVFEAEVEELVRQRTALEQQAKTVENETLKKKVQESIKKLKLDEDSKREELSSLKEQMKTS